MPRPVRKLELPQPHGVDVEVTLKRREDKQEKALRLHKEKLTFYFRDLLAYVFGFAFLAVASFYCYWVLSTPSTTLEERRYAWSALSGVMGAIVGIVYGRSTK